MFYRQRTLGRMAAPTPPAAGTATIPASVGGVNALDPLISNPPQDCYFTYNLMPSERGLRLRQGYREWVTGIGTTQDEVRGVVPFEGVDPANNKLFAVTADGIYDVTTAGSTSPTRVQAFASSLGQSGYVTWCEFVTDAPETFLFVSCPENGLFQYRESTGAWTVPSFTVTGGGSITAANIAFVTSHQQRLWFVLKNSTDAYYSAIAGAIAGDFTLFTFGSKFTYGGDLVGLYSWTLDGGNGIDDYLVAVGRGGDVLAYQGYDPDSINTWQLKGSFFVGQIPQSRRITAEYAGELFILSTFGVTSLRDLTSGVDASDNARSPSAKINRILRPEIQALISRPGWQMTTYPGDGFLQILQPWDSENSAIQYSQNLLTKAWGFWQNVPAKCAETWQGGYYMGSTDGRLFIYDGTLDNTTLTTPGSAISYSILTSFQALGDHALHKQVGFIRVVAVAGGDSAFSVKAIYDYDLSPNIQEPSAPIVSALSLWDTAIWDSSRWSGELNGLSKIEGQQGIGRTVAIAMKGEAITRLTIVGWDLTLVGGGFL